MRMVSLLVCFISEKLTHNQQNLIRSERRPHISLTATNEFNGPILVEVPPLNNNFNYWFAGVGISYNLDALFKSKKKLKQARIATSKAEKNYQLVKEEIENKVHEAYVNLNEAYVRLNTQQKSVQLAHENFRIVRQRYLNGLSLITDMLDASNMQLDMEFIIRKSKFPQNPKRSVRFSGKGTKRSVQKRKARNTQKAETKVL